MEVLSVCILVLDGTVQDDMVQVHKDLDDMVLGHKMVLRDMVLARRSQCGKVLGHTQVLGGMVLGHTKVRGGMVLGHKKVLGGRALDLDDMVLVGRAHTMTVDHG